jgi:hypothetical protein
MERQGRGLAEAACRRFLAVCRLLTSIGLKTFQLFGLSIKSMAKVFNDLPHRRIVTFCPS